MIVHGAKDTQVSKEHSGRFVEQLRKKDIPVEYIVFRDEGHRIHKSKNRVEFARRLETFLATHLGGRAGPKNWNMLTRRNPLLYSGSVRIVGATFLTFLLITPGTLMADQTDQRLADLFSRLQTTDDANDAAAVTNLIWTIWHQSGDDRINQLMHQGLAQMSTRQYADAVATFSEIIELNARFAEGWNKRATVYYLMGEYRASVKDIDRTLELEPRHFGALSGLGLIMVAMDNDEAAIAAFEATLAVNPFAAGAEQNLEALRARQKRRTF